MDWFLALPAAASSAIIAAAISMIGVVLAAIIALSSSRKSIYINSVTVERSKWIDALRNNISTLSGLARSLNYRINFQSANFARMDPFGPEANEYVEKLNSLVSLITLQLNPNGVIDSNIIPLLSQVTGHVHDNSTVDLNLVDNCLIEHSQWLLKAEWERVKLEASGPVRQFVIRCKMRRHLRAYRKFAKGSSATRKDLVAPRRRPTP